MRKPIFNICVFICVCFFITRARAVLVYAQVGDMGFFGGISEGRMLPRTTEQLLVQTRNNNNRSTFNYKELVFLGGRPQEFNGRIDITVSGAPNMDSPGGAFNVNYRVYASPGSANDVTIARTANFTVTYRVEGSQVIYNYDIVKNSWRETITTPDGTFTLDSNMSSYNISIIEDRTPGVNYYRGDVSGQLIYNSGENPTTSVQTGSFYGYSCAWSSTETHRLNVTVMSEGWAMQYQIRPSVTVNKILQYTANEPTAISFEGNYKEVLQNVAGLKYDILLRPNFIWDEPLSGTASISSVNTFEQLPAVDLAFLKGNAAEDNIRRLFAMQVLSGLPEYYLPGQAITRGQFVTALAKAIKLPIEENARPAARGTARQPIITYLFSDVDSTRPEYNYVLAINKAGIAHGRQNGSFDFDQPIQRQEAITMMVRALGLTPIGLNPTAVTRFADDNLLADWAKREIAVADRLGLIAPDAVYGRLYPTRLMTKGEAAGLLNVLIEYMRNGLVSDYADQIVNIPR